MAFISVDDEVAKKSFTSVENKFITKYLPILEPAAVKIYLYSLFLYQNGRTTYTLTDLAESLSMTEDEVKGYFGYLEELELVSIVSESPFEIKILEADNMYGSPKKYKAEKFSDFTKSVQNIIKGRMISTNEFREYFFLLEEYGFEQNALLMIINYCVNLKGDNIRLQYIKKVALSFADDGATTAKKVEEKLSAYTTSTPMLIRLFNAAGIKKQPDIDDDKLYKKWTEKLGFEEEAIISAAKQFKVKTCEKLDVVLEELYKNKKFDLKEIEDYCKNKNSVYALTLEIAKSLGVYMQNSAPYVETYVNVWCDCGFSLEMLKTIANYCFKQGKNSFADMDAFIQNLYREGIVADKSVETYINAQTADEKLLKELLTTCGLSRKVIPWDRESLSRWRSWNFGDEMLFEAAKLSSGKSNPMAYMNGILSSWKADGIYSADKISSPSFTNPGKANNAQETRSAVERHYSDLRHAAETRAENILKSATSDEIYGAIHRQLNELNIQLAFAELRGSADAQTISRKIEELELRGNERLKQLNISKEDFKPQYLCKKCHDTGYLKDGTPCACMKKFLSDINL